MYKNQFVARSIPLPTVSSAGRLSTSNVTATATSRARAALVISMAMIIFLRSNRSVITPAGRVKTNQGSRLATATEAIKSGDLVTAEANQGYAT